MMTRALAIPESALKGFKASTFKDVASDHWAVSYLGYCNSKGIMTGYEDGTARPNQTITVNEAMTMICRALGYTSNAAELVGSWPANYISLAQRLELYKDVNAVATTDRASAAQIVYNALTKPMVYIDADGARNALGTTMLNSLGGHKHNGGYDFVLSSDEAAAAVINCAEYIGSLCTGFDNEDGHLIAVEVLSTTLKGKYKPADDTFTVGDVDYIVKATNFDFNEYVYNDVTEALTTTTNKAPIGIVNGNTATPGGITVPTTGTTKMTIAVKLNGKTIEAVYSAMEWANVNYDQFESGDLEIDKLTIDVDGPLKFKPDKNGDIDYSSFALLGVSSLDKIAEDNVIEAYTDGTYITKLTVGTKTVQGKCTKMNKDEDTFWIDGVKYGLAEYGDKPEVGATGTAYLNYDGDIAFWSVEKTTAGNYAVFVGADNNVSKTLGTNTTTVGLILKDGNGTPQEFELASSVTFTTGSATATLMTGTNILTWTTPCVVTYSLDSKGKVASIETYNAADGVITNGTNGEANINKTKTAIGSSPLASDVVVFLQNGSEWEIGSLDSFSTSKDVNASVFKFIVFEKGKIAAIAVDKASVTKAAESYGVINSVDRGTNADGDAQWQVSGFHDGIAFADTEGFLKGQKGKNTAQTPSLIGISGLYKISTDADGQISLATNSALTASMSGLTVKSVSSDGKVITTSGGGAGGKDIVLNLTDKVIVYFWDADNEEYTVLKDATKIGKKWNFDIIATDDDAVDANEYNVVICWK